MATRNLTNRFDLLRNRARAAGHRPPISALSADSTNNTSADGRTRLLPDNDEKSNNSPPGGVSTAPPEWVDIVESIQADIAEIKKKMGRLQELHTARLKERFNEDEQTEEQREIEILTQEVSRLFRQGESNLKRIAIVGNTSKDQLLAQERLVRLNVMRGFATELQNLSKAFRRQQKDFVTGLKNLEQVSEYFIDDSHRTNLIDAIERDAVLSPQNLLQLNEMKRNASERERQIIQIAQSVNELAQMFKELQVLVVEQGSVVDRIDYNIEQVLLKVQDGNKELKKADDYSKKAKSLICILVLIVLIIILIGVLVYKHKD